MRSLSDASKRCTRKLVQREKLKLMLKKLKKRGKRKLKDSKKFKILSNRCN